MRSKLLLAGLGLALLLTGSLAGCLPKNKDWTHPNVASQRKEDLQFDEDTAFCEGKTDAQTQGAARDKAMADCLTRLGWQRKE